MPAQITPDFDELATLFWRLGSMCSPSQLQGFLMGQLAVGAEIAEAKWLEQAWQLIAGVESANKQDNALLIKLLSKTQSVFAEGRLDSELILPDDDIELGQRAECLGFWCQGFLAGFALAGKQKQSDQGKQAYSNEVSEALGDIAAIAQIGVSDDEDGQQQSESDFFEVLEYVRLAAMHIYFECLPKQQPPGANVSRQENSQASEGAAQLFNKKQLH